MECVCKVCGKQYTIELLGTVPTLEDVSYCQEHRPLTNTILEWI